MIPIPRPDRSRKPWRVIGGAWRGGRVTAINGDDVTIRYVAEANFPPQESVVDRSVFAPGHVPSVNGACVVRIGNLGEQTAMADYLIIEARSARYLNLREPSDVLENFGHVEYYTTHESPYWDDELEPSQAHPPMPWSWRFW